MKQFLPTIKLMKKEGVGVPEHLLRNVSLANGSSKPVHSLQSCTKDKV